MIVVVINIIMQPAQAYEHVLTHCMQREHSFCFPSFSLPHYYNHHHHREAEGSQHEVSKVMYTKVPNLCIDGGVFSNSFHGHDVGFELADISHHEGQGPGDLQLEKDNELATFPIMIMSDDYKISNICNVFSISRTVITKV